MSGARVTRQRTAGGELVAPGPASIYEAVTRQMVEGLRDELREIKSRLNGLLFLVAGAMLVDMALRLMGR
jgi:hypothetical protein